MISPCKECDKHSPYCHVECQKYLQWLDDCKKIKANRSRYEAGYHRVKYRKEPYGQIRGDQ